MENKNKKTEKPWKVKDKKQKKKMKKWVKALLITLSAIIGTIIVLIAVTGISFLIMMNRTPDQNTDPNGLTNNPDMFTNSSELDDSDAVSTSNTKVGRKEGFYNILIIGRDKVALNTDVMICASFDTKNSKASTVQIPRDSYVEDEDGNKSKINAVFARGYMAAKSELQRLKNAAKNKSAAEVETLCKNSSLDINAETLNSYISGKQTLHDIATKFGVKKLQNVISRTFGIYFDYYAIVSTDAFVKIVDAVGGVDVYIQQDMNYDDPYQNLHIHLKKGNQHLDGKQAEGFVRYRAGYVQADIARLDAQKIFMTAFFEKLLSFSSVTKVDDIVRAVYDSIDTDMTLENAIGFVKPTLSVDLSNVTMLNMQGTAYRNGMYYSLNKAENLKIVNQHFNIFTHDLSENAINVIELVEAFPSSDNDASNGVTMEDISENQPQLNFAGKGGGNSGSQSNPDTSTLPQQPEQTGTDEPSKAEDNSETSSPDFSDESSDTPDTPDTVIPDNNQSVTEDETSGENSESEQNNSVTEQGEKTQTPDMSDNENVSPEDAHNDENQSESKEPSVSENENILSETSDTSTDVDTENNAAAA